MFSKSFIALVSVFALMASVNAQTIITPALGINGTATVEDVQQPSSSAPCGNVDIANNFANSTTTMTNANGQFLINVTNFDTPAGSRQINTVNIDSTGTGNSFNALGSMITNGDIKPSSPGTEQLLARLAGNTTCTGGPKKNLCLVVLDYE